MYDLLICSGIVVTAEGCNKADVAVVGETIVAVAPRLPRESRQMLEVDGCYVFPGFIDPHVHLSLPIGRGLVSSDDFTTGTVAAACGGTTTVIDFTTQGRGISLRRAVAERRAQADGRVAVDYGLHLTVMNDDEQTLRDLRQLVPTGYPSLKVYMTYESLMVRDPALLHIMEEAAASGALTLVHAENHDIITHLTERLVGDGLLGPQAHALSRPHWVEAEATGRAIALARAVGAPLYVVHVSCAEALAYVRSARNNGQAVYAETCPHYLLLNENAYNQPGFEGARYVMTPPLRHASNQQPLWDALADGTVDIIATDHCPWMYESQKALGKADFRHIPGGIAGVETRPVLLFSEGVLKGRITLERFVVLLAMNPARLFGLYPRKGTIAVGSDADLVIFDPRQRWTITNAGLHQHVDYTVFEGWNVQGRPVATISRGRVVVKDGMFVGEEGWGRFVARAATRARPH